MAEAKTKPTPQSPTKFIDGIADERTRSDCRTILKLMTEATRDEPKMWGSSIVGFGTRTSQVCRWPRRRLAGACLFTA